MEAKMKIRIFNVVMVLLLLAQILHQAKAEPSSNHHFNVVFSPETTAQEVVWQALNVVDTEQTLYISRHPGQYEEVGQAGLFAGNHPSHNQVIGVMVGFALFHYAVTVGIENLVQQNHDYEVVQRVWQYSNIMYKSETVWHNHEIGIKP
jgi:hypothetical protein